jgi:hypothetical protein
MSDLESPILVRYLGPYKSPFNFETLSQYLGCDGST